MRDQIVVTSDLDNAAALEHDDRIGAPDRRQPVRDDERRAIQHQVRQGLLDELLARPDGAYAALYQMQLLEGRKLERRVITSVPS